MSHGFKKKEKGKQAPRTIYHSVQNGVTSASPGNTKWAFPREDFAVQQLWEVLGWAKFSDTLSTSPGSVGSIRAVAAKGKAESCPICSLEIKSHCSNFSPKPGEAA